MKTVTAILTLLMFSGVASAQNPDPSKWMCRNLAESGNFLYQGETIFGSQACRPIPQTVPAAPAAATAPRQDAGTTMPLASTANSATTQTEAASAPPPVQAPAPAPRPNDGKVRLYVTDEPKDESIFLAAHRSGWQVNGNSSGQMSGSFVNGTGSVSGSSNGYVSGSGGSAGAAYGYSQKGADPRTVELQADLYKKCPSIVVTNDPARADYALLFRREGGKRSSMFIFGGLTGLAISAHSKVDGASVFDTNGDMVFATRARTVESAIKEVCGHLK
jgi:hypothetical protein